MTKQKWISYCLDLSLFNNNFTEINFVYWFNKYYSLPLTALSRDTFLNHAYGPVNQILSERYNK